MKFFIFNILLMQLLSNLQPPSLKYEWRKISGPLHYKILSPTSATTAVTNLETGIYKFELKVTNIHGLSSRDTMVLTVKPPNAGTYNAVTRVTLTSN